MPMLLPMPRYRCRDFQMAFYQFIGHHLLCRTFKKLLLNLQRLDLLCLHEFFIRLKILAKFGTTRKMLNASLLWNCRGCFFEFLKIVWEFFVIFVNVDMCKTVLIAGEGTDCAAIFIELLKCFCEVLTIIFTMHVYVWWRIRGTISGEKGGGRWVSPILFWILKKLP